jgi:hypothetical protein
MPLSIQAICGASLAAVMLTLGISKWLRDRRQAAGTNYTFRKPVTVDPYLAPGQDPAKPKRKTS